MSRYLQITFWVLLALQFAFIFSLPVFPGQDGALNAYYAEVTRSLLVDPQSYGGYFASRSLVPPYALMTYLFIGLDAVLPFSAAEKVLDCLILALFCLGFRSLCRALGRSGEAIALFGVPLALSRMVYLGFHNFCLGTGFALCAMACWARFADRWTPRRSLGFFAVLLLTLLSHPVTMFVALLFITADALRALIASRSFRAQRASLAHAAGACLLGSYVLRFSRVEQMTGQQSTAFGLRNGLVSMLTLGPISPFADRSFRWPLMALLTAGACIALWAAWRRRALPATTATVSFLLGITFAAAFPFLPYTMNGGSFFNERFPIFALTLVLASAATLPLSQTAIKTIATSVALVSLVLLAGHNAKARPLAREVATLSQLPNLAPGARGALCSCGNEGHTDIFFDPHLWSGARYFHRNRAILLNVPITTGNLMMLGPSRYHPYNSSDPPVMTTFFLDRPAAAPPQPDFLLLTIINPDAGCVESMSRLAQQLGLTPAGPALDRYRLFVRHPQIHQ